MRIAIDLDGTICPIKQPSQEYAELQPLPGAADRIRALRAAGHYVIILTARNMATCDGNLGKVMRNIGKITLDWLERHAIEYDEIYFGKPNAEVYIDDRAVRFDGWANIDEQRLAGEGAPAMKIVVPMAGRGSRFAGNDHPLPKPLILVAGKPMLHWAMRSLAEIPRSQVIVIALEEHQAQHDVSSIIREIVGKDVEILLLPGVTEGQLCTVLAARAWLDSAEDVLVASADTYVRSGLGMQISGRSAETRGIISVANVPGERWSFARADPAGRVLEVAEKVRISDHASTGLYYFASGRELLEVADQLIASHETTNGEYYVIPVYQKYIQRDWRVEISVASEMHDMGTPEALAAFEMHLRQKG